MNNHTQALTIFALIIEMDRFNTPYTKPCMERKELINQLNEIGYTVGADRHSNLALRMLPADCPIISQTYLK